MLSFTSHQLQFLVAVLVQGVVNYITEYLVPFSTAEAYVVHSVSETYTRLELDS
jgi:hypothetical protein